MSIIGKSLESHKKNFGAMVKRMRRDKGLSQLDLAVKCNLEKTAISRIENGRTNVTLKTIVLLSEALEIELKDLFDYPE